MKEIESRSFVCYSSFECVVENVCVCHITRSIHMLMYTHTHKTIYTHTYIYMHMHTVYTKKPYQPIKISYHNDVIKWKHFPRYWPFVRGIHRSSVNSQHNGQWRGALMSSFICPAINGWVNTREAGDLRRLRTHYDVTLILVCLFVCLFHY